MVLIDVQGQLPAMQEQVTEQLKRNSWEQKNVRNQSAIANRG